MIFGKSKKVLLADDNPSILETATLILESWGFKVLAAKDGKEAIEITTNKRPDLIILDVNMPIINGFEVCRILRKDPRTKKIPILLLTGLGKTGEVDKGFQSGADEYLIKPIDWDRLRDKVSKLLNISI